MPFRDKSFDFVVASHILEHVAEPERLLKELCRVGKAGYIETPNILFERLIPYPIHCLEIMDVDGRLIIHKKAAPVIDPVLERLKITSVHPHWKQLFHAAPDLFHVRFYWSNSIPFEVVNSDVDCGWIEKLPEEEPSSSTSYLGANWRSWGKRGLRRFYKWQRRNTIIDWEKLLQCPKCNGMVRLQHDSYSCKSCNSRYPAIPYPDFVQSEHGDARLAT